MRIRVVGRTYARGISKHFRFSRLYLFCIILNVNFKTFLVCESASLRSLNYIPLPLTVHFSMTRSVRYQPIFNTLYYTLHTEHADCLSYCFLNNVVISTVIEMVELVEILDRRLGKRSVERVRYVINNLLHLVIVKYGDISLVLCISTRLRLVTILSLLVKYLVIFHADPCNKSYISREISIEHPSVGLASLAQ